MPNGFLNRCMENVSADAGKSYVSGGGAWGAWWGAWGGESGRDGAGRAEA